VITLPGGGLLPVECTAISGAAVGAPNIEALSFDKAVEFASNELSNLQVGRYYTVNVQQMQQQGLVSPELPRLEGDILERWGWHFPQAQQTPIGMRGEERGSGEAIDTSPQTSHPEQKTVTTSQTSQGTGNGLQGIQILRSSAWGNYPILPQQLVPPANWGAFVHPTIPLISFRYPSDWGLQLIQDPTGFYGGAQITSSDGQASLVVYSTTLFKSITLEDAANEAISFMAGSRSPVEIIVQDDLSQISQPEVTGVQAVFMAFRSGTKVGAVLPTVYHPDYYSTIVNFRGVIGLASNFDRLVTEVFLKVFESMPKPGGGEPSKPKDRDNDGYPDDVDEYPDDPSRH